MLYNIWMRFILFSTLFVLGCADGSSGKDSTNADGSCPPASCSAGNECLEESSPGDAATFTLLTAQINLNKPAALTRIPGGLDAYSIPDASDCGLTGSGSWGIRLDFDTTAQTVNVASVAAGTNNAFDGTVLGAAVKPVSTNVTVNADNSFETSRFDTNLAIFGDASGTEFLAVPLQSATVSGTLSSSHACIGSYNANALSSVECMSDSSNLPFTAGGSLEGYISFENADAVVLPMVNESLCVLLGGPDDGGSPKKCLRDMSGTISAMGDWCSATDQAADASCADAVRFSAVFAARAVGG